MIKKKIWAGPSIRRLPSYLNIIKAVASQGQEFISGTVIAEELQLEAIQVRKDLSLAGAIGRPKRGYPIKELIFSIERFLSWNLEHKAAIVGAGCLGSALIGYHEFREHGLRISIAFDSDIKKVGLTLHGIKVYDINEAPSLIKEEGIKIAILTLPSEHAQKTANILVEAGIKGLWNFTNTKIIAPDEVAVWKEDLSSGYAMLSYMMATNGKQ